MKRLIKYICIHTNDGQFSDTCTEREILPVLFEDSVGLKELSQWAKDNAVELDDKAVEFKERDFTVSHGIQTKEEFPNRWDETIYWWIGLVPLPDDKNYPVQESIDNDLTENQYDTLAENQEYGLSDVGSYHNGENCLVISGWNFFHELPMLGYSIESLYEHAGVTEYSGFEDDHFRCGECGAFDHNNNGYQTNYRVIGCNIIGLNCGCYADFAKLNYEEYINDSDNAIELEIAEELENEDKLEHLERFVAGMTDSWRSHSFNGKDCSISSPDKALAKYQEKEPNSEFILSHDESGQFQTYFSIWKVKND